MVQDARGAQGVAIAAAALGRDAYFRAQRVSADGEPVELEPSFAILIVLDGGLTLWSESTEPLGCMAARRR